MATMLKERLKEAKVEELDPQAVKRVAVKATTRLLGSWGVDNEAAARLVGARSPRTWQRMKGKSWRGELSQDELTRMSALVGLYQGLHVYFGTKLADDWIKLENDGPLFNGSTPLEFMLDGGIPAIIRVRDYVDAIRGGL